MSRKGAWNVKTIQLWVRACSSEKVLFFPVGHLSQWGNLSTNLLDSTRSAVANLKIGSAKSGGHVFAASNARVNPLSQCPAKQIRVLFFKVCVECPEEHHLTFGHWKGAVVFNCVFFCLDLIWTVDSGWPGFWYDAALKQLKQYRIVKLPKLSPQVFQKRKRY